MKKLLICLMLIAGSGLSQNHNTFGRVMGFADTTGWYWRIWHVAGNPDTVVWSHLVDKTHPESESFWFPGPPPFAVWNFDFGNWVPPSPPWANGDRLLIQTDWDSAYGELTHKGFYSIINDTLNANQNPQTLQDDTLRSIPNPRPTAWDSTNGDTVFTSLDTIDLVWDLPKQTTGNPDTNNILGYALYRDTTGTGEDDTLANGNYQYFHFVKFVTDTTCKDTLPVGFDGLIYYCIRIVYRPDTTGSENEPGFSSRFISQNSVPIYNTPLVVVEEGDGKYSRSDILEIIPNPFQQMIDIRYQLVDERSGIVYSKPQITIYDVSGTLVQQWDNQTIGLSDHIVWHGIDSSGKKLPMGIYFIKLETTECTKIKKAILLR